MAPRPGWCRSSRCATASGGCAGDRSRSRASRALGTPTRRAVRRAGGGGDRDVGVTRRAGSGRRFRGRFPRRVRAGRALGIGAVDVVGDFRRETRGRGVRGSERGAHDRELRPEHGGVRADVRRRAAAQAAAAGVGSDLSTGNSTVPPGGGDASACVGPVVSRARWECARRLRWRRRCRARWSARGRGTCTLITGGGSWRPRSERWCIASSYCSAKVPFTTATLQTHNYH